MTKTILEETSQVQTVTEETFEKEGKCHEDCDGEFVREEPFSYREHVRVFGREVLEHFLSYAQISRKPDYDKCYKKARQLLSFEEAPAFLKHNSFIRSGYRGILTTGHCIESAFWWTNESINIWSHLFGLFLFIGLTINDLLVLKVDASLADKFIVATVLICFQVCMSLSAIYHTFNCRSKRDFDIFLSFDLFGIALSILAIYTSGIYYAFWCNADLQNFYMSTVTFIFVIAMILQIPQLEVDDFVKMLVFVGWAAYGVVPTFHWTIIMGGFENPVVCLLLPRVLGMYFLVGIAFFIYITKIPERFSKGRFDFIGHSHQWWHFFVLVALYYWHNTGMMYVDYRLNHACSSHMRLP